MRRWSRVRALLGWEGTPRDVLDGTLSDVTEGQDIDWVESIPVAAVVLVHGVVAAMNDAAERLVEGAGVDVPLDDWFAEVAGSLVRVDEDRWLSVQVGKADDAGRRVAVLLDATTEQFSMHSLDAVAESTFLLDGAGRPRWRSQQLRQRSGLDDRAAVQQNPSERIHPEDLPVVLNTFVDSTPEKPSRVVVRSRAVDDDERWETIEIVIHHRLDHDVLRGFLVQVHNLDDGVHLEGGIGRDDGAFLSLTEAAPVGIAVTDVVGEVVYRNRVARELLGADIQWLGSGSRWLDLAAEEHRPALREAFDAALHRDESSTVTAAFDDGAGGERWLRIATSTQYATSGRPRGLIATLEDVTDQVRARADLDAAQAQLRHLADHDPLTGLPNRANLADALHAAMERHDDRGTGLAVLFCDLDGFKPINDQHGHGAGDAVLVEVGGRLRAAVDGDAMVARMGGDEFVVLCAGGVDDDGLIALAERLHDHLRAPFDIAGEEATLAVSIGIAALAPGGTSTAENLLRIADSAMYEAKAAAAGGTVLRTVV